MITQTLDTLPQAPNSGSPANFNVVADAWAIALGTFNTQLAAIISQWNGDIVNVNALAGIAHRYTFDTTTAAADPGAGKLRLNNATQTSATALYLDVLDVLGSDLTNWLNTWDDSTSPVKGRIRLVKNGDPTKWMIFNITAMTSPAGYRSFTVAHVASSGASPIFANGDDLILAFVRNGDMGPAWTGGAIANRAYTTPQAPAFSATPTFDAALSNVFMFGTLTGNVTGVTINNPADGQTITIRFAQDATGGRTVTLPASVKAAGAIDTGVSRVSWLTITYVSSAARWEGAWSSVPA